MISPQNIEIYILCGGQSRRMGRNKSFMRWHGKSFLEWSIAAARPLSDRITLVANDETYHQFGLPVIHDVYPGAGPAAGIHAALLTSKYPSNLILSCDNPLITSDLLRFLLDHSSEMVGVNYLRKDQGDYPLIGVYQKRMSDHFERHLGNGNNQLMKIIRSHRYQAHDPPIQYHHQVQNINTPGDFARLLNTSQ